MDYSTGMEPRRMFLTILKAVILNTTYLSVTRCVVQNSTPEFRRKNIDLNRIDQNTHFSVLSQK